jgi:hypothetical protein
MTESNHYETLRPFLCNTVRLQLSAVQTIRDALEADDIELPQNMINGFTALAVMPDDSVLQDMLCAGQLRSMAKFALIGLAATIGEVCENERTVASDE